MLSAAFLKKHSSNYLSSPTNLATLPHVVVKIVFIICSSFLKRGNCILCTHGPSVLKKNTVAFTQAFGALFYYYLGVQALSAEDIELGCVCNWLQKHVFAYILLTGLINKNKQSF